MNRTDLFKTSVVVLFLLISNYSFSQFYYFYKGTSEKVVKGFTYQDNYYDTSPNGLKKFISATEMSETLKKDLTAQANIMGKNKTISDIALYGGFGIGAGIMVNEALSKSDGEQFNTGTLFAGLGVALLGGVVNWIVKPKIKDYYNFVNTFNNGHKEQKIKVGLKIDHKEQMNYGITLNF